MQVTPAILAVALGGLFAGALVGWFFRGVALIAAADHREVAKPDDGLSIIGLEPSEPKRDLAAMNFAAVPELRALTKDERLRCARGMLELLPSAAEMTGEILVDDKSELIAKGHRRSELLRRAACTHQPREGRRQHAFRDD